MPQLVRGGKWVFGWSVVRERGLLPIPLDAWHRYTFGPEKRAIFIRGSATSGGFAIAPASRWPAAFGPWQSSDRVLGVAELAANGIVRIPEQLGLLAGERLLVVNGSGHALGFITRGPIVEAARTHPELETFI
ncbi:MAG: hypothetical protein JXC32_07235 [Anaerolineae bacterium]|nr:hypothetical protein [Anaerolineae bacterium]